MTGPQHTLADSGVIDSLADFVRHSRRLLVLTGAGCSTESGIPDYRDEEGEWKRRRPVQYVDFVRYPEVRRRYWARSMIGWPAVARARPNGAHRALARLQSAGRVDRIVTQNVDGLHQKAGSRRVIDLHGRLDRVVCLDCRRRMPRDELQRRLDALNPGFEPAAAAIAPDGDADLDARIDRFRVPSCPACGGVLKPAVVFFGENVPRRRADLALRRLRRSDALLVVGSSLMIWSGFRFARLAAELGLPVAAVNLGRTRADELLRLKVRARCGEALPHLADHLLPIPSGSAASRSLRGNPAGS